MSSNRYLGGIALLIFTTVSWGAMFPIAKAALGTLDGFWITLLRYGSAAPIFLVILALMEGRRAFTLEGKGLSLLVLGTLGFAGFSILAFVGLSHSKPEHGAIIMALMPLITAIMAWVTKGIKPSPETMVCVAVALVGVILVVTGGNAASISGGALAWDVMILAGAVCWVLYTMGAQKFPGWSPVRYTALSCGLGALSILAITVAASAAGISKVPSPGQITAVVPELLYLIIIAGVMAVFSWNIGVKRLGPLNGVLFINLVPVTAFAIGAFQGRVFSNIELIGAALTISALIANNLLARKSTPAPIALAASKS